MDPILTPTRSTFSKFGPNSLTQLAGPRASRPRTLDEEEVEETPLEPVRKGSTSYFALRQFPQAARTIATMAASGNITDARELLATLQLQVDQRSEHLGTQASYDGKDIGKRDAAAASLNALSMSFLDQKVSVAGGEATLRDLLDPESSASQMAQVERNRLSATVAAGNDPEFMGSLLANSADPYIRARATPFTGVSYKSTMQRYAAAGDQAKQMEFMDTARSTLEELQYVSNYVSAHGGSSQATHKVVQHLKSLFANPETYSSEIPNWLEAFNGGGAVTDDNVYEVLRNATDARNHFFQATLNPDKPNSAAITDLSKMPPQDVRLWDMVTKSLPHLTTRWAKGKDGGADATDVQTLIPVIFNPQIRDKAQVALATGMFNSRTDDEATRKMVDFLATQVNEISPAYSASLGFSEADPVSLGVTTLDYLKRLSNTTPDVFQSATPEPVAPGSTVEAPDPYAAARMTGLDSSAATFCDGLNDILPKHISAYVSNGAVDLRGKGPADLVKAVLTDPTFRERIVKDLVSLVNQHPDLDKTDLPETFVDNFLTAYVDEVSAAPDGTLNFSRIASRMSTTKVDDNVLSSAQAETNALVAAWSVPNPTEEQQLQRADLVVSNVFSVPADTTIAVSNEDEPPSLSEYLADSAQKAESIISVMTPTTDQYAKVAKDFSSAVSTVAQDIADAASAAAAEVADSEGDKGGQEEGTDKEGSAKEPQPAKPRSWANLTEREKEYFRSSIGSKLKDAVYPQRPFQSETSKLTWDALTGGSEEVESALYDAVIAGDTQSVTEALVQAHHYLGLHAKAEPGTRNFERAVTSLSRSSNVDITLILKRFPHQDPAKVQALKDQYIDLLNIIHTSPYGLSTSVYMQLGLRPYDDVGVGLQGVIFEASRVNPDAAYAFIETLQSFKNGEDANPVLTSATLASLKLQLSLERMYNRLEESSSEINSQWGIDSKDSIRHGLGVSSVVLGALANGRNNKLIGLGASGAGYLFNYLGTPDMAPPGVSLNRHPEFSYLGLPDGLPGEGYAGSDDGLGRATSRVVGAALHGGASAYDFMSYFPNAKPKTRAIVVAGGAVLAGGAQIVDEVLDRGSEDDARIVYEAMSESLTDFEPENFPPGPVRTFAEEAMAELNSKLSVQSLPTRERSRAIATYINSVHDKCREYIPPTTLSDDISRLAVGYTMGSAEHKALTQPSNILKKVEDNSLLSDNGIAGSVTLAASNKATLNRFSAPLRRKQGSSVLKEAIKQVLPEQSTASKDPTLTSTLYTVCHKEVQDLVDSGVPVTPEVCRTIVSKYLVAWDQAQAAEAQELWEKRKNFENAAREGAATTKHNRQVARDAQAQSNKIEILRMKQEYQNKDY